MPDDGRQPAVQYAFIVLGIEINWPAPVPALRRASRAPARCAADKCSCKVTLAGRAFTGKQNALPARNPIRHDPVLIGDRFAVPIHHVDKRQPRRACFGFIFVRCFRFLMFRYPDHSGVHAGASKQISTNFLARCGSLSSQSETSPLSGKSGSETMRIVFAAACNACAAASAFLRPASSLSSRITTSRPASAVTQSLGPLSGGDGGGAKFEFGDAVGVFLTFADKNCRVGIFQ